MLLLKKNIKITTLIGTVWQKEEGKVPIQEDLELQKGQKVEEVHPL